MTDVSDDTNQTAESPRDREFVYRRCLRLARQQAERAKQDALAYHTICKVHGPDTNEVDLPTLERSLLEQTWTIGELGRLALDQLEAHGIDPTETYLQAVETGTERDKALFMDDTLGPIVALIGDSIQHLERAERASRIDPASTGRDIAAATIQAQQAAMFLGVLHASSDAQPSD